MHNCFCFSLTFSLDPYEAEHLLKDIDIHAVTGLLKMYLRELPEALFTNALYKKFFDAFSKFLEKYDMLFVWWCSSYWVMDQKVKLTNLVLTRSLFIKTFLFISFFIGLPTQEEKKRKLIALFAQLPHVNQNTITFLIEHLAK